MAWTERRNDRLRQIVAELIREGVTPRHSLYANKVHQIACGRFGVAVKTAKDYTKILGLAWERYRWINWVRENPYLSEAEREEWIEKNSRQR